MRVLGNILWHFPFFGFISALFTFLLGTLLVITVIGAPIGFGLIELAKFELTPFSSVMVSGKDLNIKQNAVWEKYGLLIRILYFPLGLISAIIVSIQAGLLFCTIIGIPVALVLAKSVSTYFNPVNKKCVPKAVADELDRLKSQEYLKNLGAKSPNIGEIVHNSTGVSIESGTYQTENVQTMRECVIFDTKMTQESNTMKPSLDSTVDMDKVNRTLYFGMTSIGFLISMMLPFSFLFFSVNGGNTFIGIPFIIFLILIIISYIVYLNIIFDLTKKITLQNRYLVIFDGINRHLLLGFLSALTILIPNIIMLLLFLFFRGIREIGFIASLLAINFSFIVQYILGYLSYKKLGGIFGIISELEKYSHIELIKKMTVFLRKKFLQTH